MTELDWHRNTFIARSCWMAIAGDTYFQVRVVTQHINPYPPEEQEHDGLQIVQKAYPSEVILEESPIYWTATVTGRLTIVNVVNNLVMVQSVFGQTYQFDLTTRQWVTNSTPTPTPPPSSFPSTGLLDSFNRADGAVGSAWVSPGAHYEIGSNALLNAGGNASTLLWDAGFGADQEVYVTLSAIDSSASEIDLVLKAQTVSECDLLEILYQPASATVQVWTCHNWGTWAQHGSDISVTLQAGDQFGARAMADGTVEVYKNGALVGSVTVDASWPYLADGGRVGVWLIDAPGTVLDDFGGGTLP